MPKRHRHGSDPTSILARIEEIVLATSGEDAFELVFALSAARVVGRSVSDVRRRHPELGVLDLEGTDSALRARVDDLLAKALPVGDSRHGGLDAVFESLVSRLSKGAKGQFFTPRYVVEFVVRALAPKAKELVVDPACGSGAFLAHAHALARVRTLGSDVDARAVRVARLLAIAQGRDATTITRADGLRGKARASADCVATNPPFAGRAEATGFEVSKLVTTPERDALFLERSLELLRPGGRLGIVLPYNKAAAGGYASLRRWLFDRARVLAVVGLPHETFMPHTSQRTFVLFAKKRGTEKRKASEPTLFVTSDGDDRKSDLGLVATKLERFFAKEEFFA